MRKFRLAVRNTAKINAYSCVRWLLVKHTGVCGRLWSGDAVLSGGLCFEFVEFLVDLGA